MARTIDKLQLLFTIDALTFNTKSIRKLACFRSVPSLFISASEDGQAIIWQINW